MILELLKKRIFIIKILFVFVFLLLLGFIFYTQVFSVQNNNQFITSLSTIYSQRGNIYDRNGILLAYSVPSNSILIHPAWFNSDEETISTLASVGGISVNEFNRKLESGRNFYLIRQLTDIPDEVKNIRGVSILEEKKRLYPFANNLSHLLGYVDLDGEGRSGIEGFNNEVLKGKSGLALITIDANGRGIPTYPEGTIKPVQGSDIYLTLDIQVQRIVEKALAEGVEKYQAKSGSAMVMDITSGEIWAQANFPDYDLNNYYNYTAEERRNIAVAYNYEPGSVLKTFTIGIGLEEGIVSLSSEFSAPSSMRVKGGVINNFQNKDFQVQNLKSALRTSTNTVFAQLAFRIGEKNFTKYYNELFGIGRFNIIDLFGVERGIYSKPDKEMHLANIGFGQGISLTLIQLANIYATMGNGGYFIRPNYIHQIRDYKGWVEWQNQVRVLKTVFRKETSEKILQSLEGTITAQHNRSGYLKGYLSGGKTGTAQKVIDGKYSNDKIIATFAGFISLNNPRFLILVMLDEPNVPAYASALPIYGEIARNLVNYLPIENE